ncbi:sortase [Patescibacteria group bacterium]|nr:MAG: sortase [Patescibacteria group bacterium]
MRRYHHAKSPRAERRYRRANYVLFVLIVLINGYVLLAPLWPSVSFQIKAVTTKPLPESGFATIDRSQNRLIIPSLRLEQPIHDNPDPKTLDLGVWLRPNTSTPDKGSNTVMSGHRWLYNNPSSAVFYNLDKVKTGDHAIVVWNEKIYVYVVGEIKTVLPTAIEVEDPTENNQLTLYTCTPLWTASHRLVLVSNLKEVL